MGWRYKVGRMGKGQRKRGKFVGLISSAIKTNTLTFA